MEWMIKHRQINYLLNIANGVGYASFNGGTNIFIKGAHLNENPQSNSIYLRSVELDATVQAPQLTEDDAF